MEWQDEGTIIGARRHGETSLILEVMTRTHGRHLGLVKGGRGKRLQPLLQPGNRVQATWRARLEEHLGFYAIETTRLRAADLLACQNRLQRFNVVAALLRLLAEREPHEALYALAETLLDCEPDSDAALASLVRFEVALLAQTGFGLNLDSCAATGRRDELVYVSPRTGCAVSRDAGQPYRDRLLPLPPFLVDPRPGAVTRRDIIDGFALTGRFLARDLLTPRNLTTPPARDALIARLRDSVDRG